MSKLNANSVELGSLTTSQRDALSAVAGEVIYNSTTGSLQAYSGTQWVEFAQLTFVDATGGTKTSTARAGYNVHTFTSPGTFSVTSNSGTVEYLVVAGGGSGEEDLTTALVLKLVEVVHWISLELYQFHQTIYSYCWWWWSLLLLTGIQGIILWYNNLNRWWIWWRKCCC